MGHRLLTFTIMTIIVFCHSNVNFRNHSVITDEHTEAQRDFAGSALDLAPRRPPANTLLRIFSGIVCQRGRSRVCPPLPRLDGKRVLITGGTAGVGEFVTRGLLERGALVTTMSRGRSQGSARVPGITELTADLAQFSTVVDAVNQLDTAPVDILICNSGVLMSQNEFSSSGLEKTFAVNVAGHHLLYRLLIQRGLLAPDARLIITTGDIYRSAEHCSKDLPFDSPARTYARSKLGNLWQVSELSWHFPHLTAIAIHPGVVASGFAGAKGGLAGWLRGKLLIDEQAGAQAALIAATQQLPRGAYWHNVFGLVDLADDDPGQDEDQAGVLWEQLEWLIAPYLSSADTGSEQ